MAPKSVESPRLATGIPLTNTVLEPLFTFALCPTQNLPIFIVWGATGSPRLNNGIPLANTLPCVAMTGAVAEQACPVLHLSRFLDILGIWIFIAVENRYDFLSRRCMASGINRGFSSQPTSGASIRK